MYISKIQILNYKSFLDSGELEFSPIIEQKRIDGAYLPNGTNKDSLSYDNWVSKVHGANILKDVFHHFTDTIPFDKTTHSPLITEWLADNETEHLSELTELLKEMLSKS